MKNLKTSKKKTMKNLILELELKIDPIRHMSSISTLLYIMTLPDGPFKIGVEYGHRLLQNNA